MNIVKKYTYINVKMKSVLLEDFASMILCPQIKQNYFVVSNINTFIFMINCST